MQIIRNILGLLVIGSLIGCGHEGGKSNGQKVSAARSGEPVLTFSCKIHGPKTDGGNYVVLSEVPWSVSFSTVKNSEAMNRGHSCTPESKASKPVTVYADKEETQVLASYIIEAYKCGNYRYAIMTLAHNDRYESYNIWDARYDDQLFRSTLYGEEKTETYPNWIEEGTTKPIATSKGKVDFLYIDCEINDQR